MKLHVFLCNWVRSHLRSELPDDARRAKRVVDVSSRNAFSVLIGPLALALMLDPSQEGICDPLSHLGRTCRKGSHIVAPGGKQNS